MRTKQHTGRNVRCQSIFSKLLQKQGLSRVRSCHLRPRTEKGGFCLRLPVSSRLLRDHIGRLGYMELAHNLTVARIARKHPQLRDRQDGESAAAVMSEIVLEEFHSFILFAETNAGQRQWLALKFSCPVQLVLHVVQPLQKTPLSALLI